MIERISQNLNNKNEHQEKELEGKGRYEKRERQIWMAKIKKITNSILWCILAAINKNGI